MLFNTIPQGFAATGWAWSATTLSINTLSNLLRHFPLYKIKPANKKLFIKELEYMHKSVLIQPTI